MLMEGPKKPTEGLLVEVECTNAACRGKLRYGKGLPARILASKLEAYKAGTHKAECNECFGK